jgi:lipoprotein-releasing system permease protein
MILGAGVENAIGVQTDRNLLALNVYLPRRSSSELIDPMQNISEDSINTAGTFVIQQDFDNKYAITNIGFIKTMLGLKPNEYTAVEMKLAPQADIDQVQARCRQLLGHAYKVQTRYELNQGLYSIMRVERWVIYAILVLLMVVFSFTLVSSLTMLVIEKQKDISVLRALGGNDGFVQRIFLSEGLLLSFLGAVAGMLLAILLAWMQVHLKLIPLAGGSFLIDYFPVQLKGEDFLLVSVTVIAISLLASWVPARKASHNDFSLRAE